MKSLEDIAIEVDEIGDLINAVSLLVRPINTDVNGQGAPTYDAIAGSFLAILEHTKRIAEDIRYMQQFDYRSLPVEQQ